MGEIVAEIRGLSFNPPAKGIVSVLRVGARLELEIDPANDRDPVSVFVRPSEIPNEDRPALELRLGFPCGQIDLDMFDFRDRWKLGCVAREIASDLRALLMPSDGRGDIHYTAEFARSPKGEPQVRVQFQRT